MEIQRELIYKCVKKDRVSQKALYEILMPYLNSVCRRYLYNQSNAKDALQESFISIFSNIDKYDEQRSKIQTWCVRITINCCLKINAKEHKMLYEEVDDANMDYENPAVLQKLSNQDMLNMLKTMPADYYVVFNLYIIDGYSHREISSMLNIDV